MLKITLTSYGLPNQESINMVLAVATTYPPTPMQVDKNSVYGQVALDNAQHWMEWKSSCKLDRQAVWSLGEQSDRPVKGRRLGPARSRSRAIAQRAKQKKLGMGKSIGWGH
jgi:hypothetical protein